MDLESGSSRRRHGLPKPYPAATLLLAYQSFGVVYGDLSISPIYVFKSTFSGKMHFHEDENGILGVVSMIFWTLTLVPLIKYIIVVLAADDRGEGGTFALYSLMCRHAKMGVLSIPHSAHEQLSAYDSEEQPSNNETKTSLIIKEFFEKYQSSRVVLLLVVLLGIGMVVGDGILTPCMSVLSAVSGVKVKVPDLKEEVTIIIACLTLMALFGLQHFGTHRVGFLFAPVQIAWLLCLSSIGIYNIFKWNSAVMKAMSPVYIYRFFNIYGKDAWISLGGIVLSITGGEAMFADLGHFSKRSIRVAFIGVVYPCLILAYMGQAAYLSKHKVDIQGSFFRAIPEDIFWPVFVVATLATAVASQAIISAIFSIISQCRALKCFPRVKIVHTSSTIHGQIYIPEANWILMFLCVAVTIGFRDTDMIGNAYGLAVISVMFITTCLMFLIITTIWKQTILMALVFVMTFGSLELLYLSACIVKVPHGGWLPLLFSLFVLFIMSVWHYGTYKKEKFELENRVSLSRLLNCGPSLGLVRVPGIGLMYSNTVTGIPTMFAHFITNFPAFHRVLIFTSVQSLTIPKVPHEARFLVSRVGPPQYRLFQCIVRYGYKDERRNYHEFEDQLIWKVVEFLQQEGASSASGTDLSVGGNSATEDDANAVDDTCASDKEKEVSHDDAGTMEEIKELLDARESGVTYMIGNVYVKAQVTSSVLKKLVIDIVYRFLRQNCRHSAVILGVPHTSLIEVGMIYRV